MCVPNLEMNPKKVTTVNQTTKIQIRAHTDDKLDMTQKSKLTLSLLMTTQEAFVDSVDQDYTAHYVQSDL